MIVFDTSVTVVTYATMGVDRLGKPIRVEVRRRRAVPARLTQVRSDENPTFVTDRYRALISPTVRIGPADRVEHEGRVFRVEGTAERKGVPGFMGLDHLAVNLVRISES